MTLLLFSPLWLNAWEKSIKGGAIYYGPGVPVSPGCLVPPLKQNITEAEGYDRCDFKMDIDEAEEDIVEEAINRFSSNGHLIAKAYHNINEQLSELCFQIRYL